METPLVTLATECFCCLMLHEKNGWGGGNMIQDWEGKHQKVYPNDLTQRVFRHLRCAASTTVAITTPALPQHLAPPRSHDDLLSYVDRAIAQLDNNLSLHQAIAPTLAFFDGVIFLYALRFTLDRVTQRYPLTTIMTTNSFRFFTVWAFMGGWGEGRTLGSSLGHDFFLWGGLGGSTDLRAWEIPECHCGSEKTA